jgi:hypothetical protein
MFSRGHLTTWEMTTPRVYDGGMQSVAPKEVDLHDDSKIESVSITSKTRKRGKKGNLKKKIWKKEEKAEKRTHNKRRRRNNKIRRARVLQVKNNQVAPKMEMMIIIKSPRLKRKQARQYMAIARRHEFVSLNYNSMPNLDSGTLVNAHVNKLPYFNGTIFAKWKHMIKV